MKNNRFVPLFSPLIIPSRPPLVNSVRLETKGGWGGFALCALLYAFKCLGFGAYPVLGCPDQSHGSCHHRISTWGSISKLHSSPFENVPVGPGNEELDFSLIRIQSDGPAAILLKHFLSVH